jgi:predicted enzyme related to lactoylglutathione lyase
MPTELGYLTIPVQSIPRAKAFFEALFGWRLESMGDGSGAHVGNTRLPIGFSIGGPADYANLYFKVSDIGAAIAQIVELGGGAGEVHPSASGLSARCHDDQGTVFSLWQPAPGYEG